MDDDRFIIIAFHQGKNGIYELIKEYAINVAKIDSKILNKDKSKSDVPAFEAWLKSLPEEERDSMFTYVLENTPIDGDTTEEIKINREKLRNYVELAIKTKNTFAEVN